MNKSVRPLLIAGYRAQAGFCRRAFDWYNITTTIACIEACPREEGELSNQPPGRYVVEGRQPSTPKTPTNALYKDAIPTKRHRGMTFLRVEPVLCTVLDSECTGKAITCLGRYTSGCMYPVDFLIITIDGVELQPRDAAQAIATFACVCGRNTLDNIGHGMYRAVVHGISLKLEERDFLLCELVVT